MRRAREKFYQDFNELEKETYIVLDIETTGLNPQQDELIEIGALKVESKDIKGIYNPLIKPKKPITKEIELLTNISNDFVSNSPTIEDVLPEFIEFLGDSIIVAHNAEFDVGFLEYHVRNILGKELNNKSICTLKLSRYLLPELSNYKLHTVADYFNVPTPIRHRALGDTEITYQIWLKLLGELKKREITTKEKLFALLDSLK